VVRRAAALLPALGLGLALLVPGCASGPRPAPQAAAPPPPGVSVEVRMSRVFGRGLAPQTLWFARVAALDGSTCVPRPTAFAGRDATAGASELGGADAGGRMALIGSDNGEGGFSGGDPTCMYDEIGNPVWDPLLYQANRIQGGRAYLDAPPPARYVAVAAVFKVDAQGSTDTVYFPHEMIARTERPVPFGEAVDMGRYKVSPAGWGGQDPAQKFVRSRIEPLGPSRTVRVLGAILSGLANNGQAQMVLHVAGRMDQADAPPAAELDPLPW
jgi:hypothetical protein